MVRIADVPIKDVESAGLRKSNLSRSKGHVYKYVSVAFVNDGTRKAIVKFNDINDRKQITRVGFYEAIGAEVALVKIVSFEGQKDDVNDNVCIIISSLEAFRKEKTLQKKYKVYQENGRSSIFRWQV